MSLSWSDVRAIGEALYDANPEVDPLTLSVVRLHEMIVNLPDFSDDPEKSNEALLEAILQVWLDERD